MDVVVIPQSIFAMSAPSNGSLDATLKQIGKSLQKGWSKASQDGNVSRVVKGDTSHCKTDERQRKLVALHRQVERPTFAVCIGDSYNFHHRHVGGEQNKLYADRAQTLKEVALLKTTEDSLSWLVSCKKLLSELQALLEDQCSASDQHETSMASFDCNKASRLLNLFERCRILVAGFKEIKRKVLFCMSAMREQFAHPSALSRFLTSMAASKMEILQAAGSTFRMEVVLFVRYMSNSAIRQVDFGNYLCERTENLCLLFEKYGKLALLLRTMANDVYRHEPDTAHFIHSVDGNNPSLLQAYERDSGSGVHGLLSCIAKLRIPSFISSTVLSFERLVKKRLLQKFIGKEGSGTSLSTSPNPETGESPLMDSETVPKIRLSDQSVHQVCKRIQKRFWHELALQSEDEIFFAATLVNAASGYARNQGTVKRPNVSIVRHQHDSPNGVRLLDQSWAGTSGYGEFKIGTYIISKETKRVHFSEGKTYPERRDLQELYMKSFWQEFLRIFKVASFFQDKADGEQSVLLRAFGNQELGFALLTCLSPNKQLVAKGALSSELVSCMASLFTSFSAMSFIQSWETCFSKTLPCAIRDRCRPTQKGVTDNPVSQTAAYIIKSFQPLLKLANITSKLASRSSAERALPLVPVSVWEIQYKCLSSLAVQLQVTLSWFITKARQFLASGSWELFFSVVKNDLSTVVCELDPLSQSMATLAECISSHCAPETYSFSVLEEINKRLDELKGVESDSVSRLISNVRERSEVVWSQTMPVPKQWRKRGVTVIPFQANSYVELAATQVLAPLMDTMKGFDKIEIENMFCKCVRVFLQTWMAYFLEREIKFSYYGAHQLRLDLNNFRQWLSTERPLFSADVAASALSIRLFDEFDGVISLLCCQPQSRHRGGSEGDLSTANSASSSSVSQGSFSGSANFEDVIRDVDIPNKHQWLLLRAKGSRRTRLLCLSAPE